MTQPIHPQRPLESAGIAGIVLAERKGPTRHVRVFALLVGLMVHLGVGLASAMLPPPAPTVVVAVRPPVRVSIARDLELQPPEPPPEAVEPPPAEVAEAQPSREAPRQEAPAPEAPAAAPAVAADVVQTAAPEPAAAEPVDFSVVTGQGQVYAGGVTASTGTSTRAVHAGNVDARNGVLGGTGTGVSAPSRARPVGQPSRAWRCRWPSAADGLDVDVEFVDMRVHVSASGEISDVRVLRHAGYGFDTEATRCALRNRLPPRHDDAGVAVATPSHPIRLRIER